MTCQRWAYLTLIILLQLSCKSSKLPTTLGDPKNAQPFGYQPLDPLPVHVHVNDLKKANSEKDLIPYTTRLMNSLPDETMRLAIGQVDANSNVSFVTAKLGYEGNSYVVILDYIKFDTKSFSTKIKRERNLQPKSKTDTISIRFYPIVDNTVDVPDAVIPVYVGVGLRLTATVTVNKGSVDLGNLFALGVAAESKQVTGTLVIQTLGISGSNISTIIPMPNEINTTTIQNAILALGSIRAKMYESEVRVTPRIVGFYNTVGGGQASVNQFISTFLSGKPIEHDVD